MFPNSVLFFEAFLFIFKNQKMCQIEPQLCMLNKCKSLGLLRNNLRVGRREWLRLWVSKSCKNALQNLIFVSKALWLMASLKNPFHKSLMYHSKGSNRWLEIYIFPLGKLMQKLWCYRSCPAGLDCEQIPAPRWKSCFTAELILCTGSIWTPQICHCVIGNALYQSSYKTRRAF